MVKVTVLVPAFNEEGTIDKVLSKLLALSLESKEILVVDDGSTDKTAEVVASYIPKQA